MRGAPQADAEPARAVRSREPGAAAAGDRPMSSPPDGRSHHPALSIRRKLGIDSTAGLVRYAIEQSWIA